LLVFNSQNKIETLAQPNADLFPKIVDNPDGTKAVNLKFSMPVGVDPSNVNVTLKDRDLILRCEDKKAKDDQITKFHYYQVSIIVE
jgi:HSP20 family molecular chaperone IbpA